MYLDYILFQQISYESCKGLGAWVTDLVKRIDFFSEWCEVTVTTADKIIRGSQQQQGQSQSQSGGTSSNSANNLPQPQEVEDPATLMSRTQPCSFWLSAFFFPQGMLNSSVMITVTFSDKSRSEYEFGA